MLCALRTHYSWSLDLFIQVLFQHPFLEHTALQPFRRKELIADIAISVLPGTYFQLNQVKHVRVKWLAQGHSIKTMSQYCEGRNEIFLLHQAGFETARQTATSQSSTLEPLRHIPLYSANTKHSYNICTTLAQHHRRWSNIAQILYKCCVFWVDRICPWEKIKSEF